MSNYTLNVSQINHRQPLHWFSWHPTPYNDVLFQELATLANCSLMVHYRSKVLPSHPWQSPLGQGYPVRYDSPLLGIDWRILHLSFTDKSAIFVVAGWNHPTTFFLLSLLRLFGRRYVLWTDTPNLDRHRPIVRAWLRRRWLVWIFRGAHRLLATGQPGVSALGQMGAPEHLLESFPFWIDPKAFDRNALQDQIEKEPLIRFISSGRLLNAIKGHDVALRALAIAMRDRSLDWEYIIAGRGPDAEALKRLAYDLGISSNVVFAGWVEPDSLRQLYFRSDILIHSSPVHDPFPNAVLEGMAASLVVMGSDACGSVRDRIESGVNGFMHRAGDFHHLAEQIGQVVDNPSLLTDMGQKARATAELWPVERGVSIVERLFA